MILVQNIHLILVQVYQLVLLYHDLGIFKWEKLGIAYPLINVKPPTKERVENAKKLLYTSEYRGYLSR